MADYFGHWLSLAEREGAQLPKIFCVNWFRKDEDGKFIWPGFGENSRVLEWVFRRCDGEGETVESPLGLLPAEGEINTEGADVTEEQMRELFNIDPHRLNDQVAQIEEHLSQFAGKLPPQLTTQLRALEDRLSP
jgi:phosphoenolpyruvate carboxykinase (GTP)